MDLSLRLMKQTQNFEKAKDELEAWGNRGWTEDKIIGKKGIDVDNLKTWIQIRWSRCKLKSKQLFKKYKLRNPIIDSSSSKVKETTKQRKRNLKQTITQVKKNNSNLDPRSRYLESTKRMSVKWHDAWQNILLDSMPPAAIWGQEIFRNQSLDVYKDADNIKPPDSYVLGVGDQITVMIWGQSQLNEIYEINTDGYITPTRDAENLSQRRNDEQTGNT